MTPTSPGSGLRRLLLLLMLLGSPRPRRYGLAWSRISRRLGAVWTEAVHAYRPRSTRHLMHPRSLAPVPVLAFLGRSGAGAFGFGRAGRGVEPGSARLSGCIRARVRIAGPRTHRCTRPEEAGGGADRQSRPARPPGTAPWQDTDRLAVSVIDLRVLMGIACRQGASRQPQPYNPPGISPPAPPPATRASAAIRCARSTAAATPVGSLHALEGEVGVVGSRGVEVDGADAEQPVDGPLAGVDVLDAVDARLLDAAGDDPALDPQSLVGDREAHEQPPDEADQHGEPDAHEEDEDPEPV